MDNKSVDIVSSGPRIQKNVNSIVNDNEAIEKNTTAIKSSLDIDE